MRLSMSNQRLGKELPGSSKFNNSQSLDLRDQILDS